MDGAGEIAAEQAHVDHAYERLAAKRGIAADAQDDRTATVPRRLRSARDAIAFARARRESELRLGDLPLCFGRIDVDSGEAWHIGRLAVDDEEREPLVVDWRAPVSEPFYRATAEAPSGVVRRRHLRCRGSTVLELDDEVLEQTSRSDALTVVGEAALLRAVQRRRTGRMADIVATIQRAQDEIIRAPLDQAMVVQGGPGTGKTAVALHRIAYLVYTHRELFESKGVLLVGPNATFLRYIESVLPSLGEQGARFRTPSTLREGAEATLDDTAEATRVKGDARMAIVLERALAGRQRPLRKSIEVGFGAHALRLSTEASRKVIAAAQARPGSHNERRKVVERLVLGRLYRTYLGHVERAQRSGQPTTAIDRDEFEARARAQQEVRALLQRLWPLLTPEALIDDLLRRPALLREAAGDILSGDEQAAILRTAEQDPDGWSAADIALLDEVAAPIGPMPTARRAKAAIEDRDFMADRVLTGLADEEDLSFNANMAAEIRDRIRADQVQRVEGTATRPRVGRSFAHVVVDEAQDLSPMQWRMIARRCPAGSMTIVGDLGQASGAWRRGWEQVLLDAAPTARHHIVELTVNYRTPSEVMEVAARVLAAADARLQPPSSIRSSGETPIVIAVAAGGVGPTVARAAVEHLDSLGAGTVAVIAPSRLHELVRAGLSSEERTRPEGRDPLDDPVALLTPDRAKGLEFDAVVVVEPSEIASDGTAGLLALYVALTRATQRLTIVHTGTLLAPLV
jgi:DNA helicase IV